MYFSTKRWGHERGFSCCFRQWRATHSHCSFLHGYALSFEFVFAARELDNLNWVVDFGGLKEIEGFLRNTYDHKTLVAIDDPDMHTFSRMHNEKVIDMVIMPNVGCERVAQYNFEYVASWLTDNYGDRVTLVSSQVWEHEGNSAIYKGEEK